MTWGHPVIGGDITSDFGPRIAPTLGASTFHNGVDFSGRGTDWRVRSVGDGKVYAAGFNAIRGWWVAVRHNDGSTTTYQHLVKPLVRGGNTVKVGTTVGMMGNSGIAIGIHLHLETFPAGAFTLVETAWPSSGRAVDPEQFMLARGIDLAHPEQDSVQTPEHRPEDEAPSTPTTPTIGSEDQDMFIIRRGSEGSYSLCDFTGEQKITVEAKNALVGTGQVGYKEVPPADYDLIVKTLRERSSNRIINPGYATSVWRDEKAAFQGGAQQTMAAHLIATRDAATKAATS